jgi:hypothetical protein
MRDDAAIARASCKQPSSHQQSSDEFHCAVLSCRWGQCSAIESRARVELPKRLSKNVLHHLPGAPLLDG